ncbi:S-adenosyl-l-methionine-dependent methyltransferases superfamily protein [Thalictrum thalictroides]|uniref:S-adenosyl-l-methionine-dependent methyltransferases superfamily protein n=1 Tax=Thalictrum thalictroides TaxID=46969 RepID=A0A7J6WUE4_THATH|nr:S-adenosyl-l-methionine-dependent methyltransferases superfamily protein [Thalictrum thalictroides]
MKRKVEDCRFLLQFFAVQSIRGVFVVLIYVLGKLIWLQSEDYLAKGIPPSVKPILFSGFNKIISILSELQISPTSEDITWWKQQLQENQLHDYQETKNKLRKGINPRTRDQQLQDLIQFKGISHYEEPQSANHTALPCPGELLVEEHHSNYGEPWAGGRDVFEFLAESVHLSPDSRVLEIGCGTLRVGIHFIRYLNSEHFHCLERDELSLIAAFRYELPSQGLLHKRPLIVKGEDMDFSKFGSGFQYSLIYASAVFLHMPDKLVWIGLERLIDRLKPNEGRIFVSHNIKFCSRLGGDECTKRLSSLGLEYVGKHTHDSLLFNHYEIWFEFRRVKA